MTVLSASSTFTIAGSTLTVENATITVLPALGSSIGKGRLVHPTLGVYDYAIMPTKWRNIDADAIIPPVWQSTMTLNSFANTLWAGTLRDVVVQELWGNEGGLSMPIAQLRQLLAFWQNPPDPSNAYVAWYPNYCSSLGFKVVMLEVSNQGSDVELDVYSQTAGFVSAPVLNKMRIAGRI